MNNIHFIPRQLGLHGTQKGYHYLIDSIQMALEDEIKLIMFTKTIFVEVARKYDTEPANVERNIRTLVEQCWNSPYREELLKFAPYRLEKKPTVGEFIDILYWHIKCMKDE